MSSDLHSLGIGEIFVSLEPAVITTILGSCVSVCLFSSAGPGGIIHYALPDKSHAKGSNRSDLNFGDLAIDHLVEKLLEFPEVKVGNLKAKIVGGASVMNELSHANAIGELNIAIAREKLKKLKIPILGESVGGDQGRKLYFFTSTGRLRVSLVNKNAIDNLPIQPTIKLKKKKKVLIIDDSRTMRDILKKILTSDELEVIGQAASAAEAEPLLKSLNPDIVTLDINMPGMNGIDFLRKYLPLHPIPTVMISSINMNESQQVMEALEIGAVDYIQKPSFDEIKTQAELIREKVLTASTINVQKKENAKKGLLRSIAFLKTGASEKIVAIGASTGGTEAIKEVLLRLPSNIPPIVIVQHIPPIFSTAFAKRLNELCPFEVKEAEDGDLIIPGRVLIAPGGLQMEAVNMAGKLQVKVYAGERVNRHIPSVDVLFQSVAIQIRDKAIGVILTGMGSDGARGLLEMKRAGAFTIGQDEESSVVYGMPKAAAEIGSITQTFPLTQIAEAITKALEIGTIPKVGPTFG